MKGPESMFGRFLAAIAAPIACLALAALCGAPANAANWSHPTIGVHVTPTPPVIITHGGAVTVKGTTATSRNGDLTIEVSTGSASPTTTVVTKTIVGANGASETTKTMVTTYGATKDIVVSGTYTPLGGKPTAYKFTFASLSAAPQTIGTAPDILTATPSAAKNTVTVKFARGHAKQGPTVTTKIGEPLVLTGTTGSSESGLITIGSVSGDSVTTITTTTTPVLDANGATTTTVTTRTSHAALSNITITGTYTTAAGATESYKFTFASLSAPAQTIGSAPDIVKATPDSKTGTITVVHVQGKGKTSPTVTVTLGTPDTLAGTTGTDKTLTVDSTSGESVTTITTTTDPVLESDGATKTTTTVVTTHGKASDITVSGTYTTLTGATLPYSFTFASLSSPAQTIGTSPATVTATPDAANHTVKIVFADGPPKPKNSTTVTTGAAQTIDGATNTTNPLVTVTGLSASTTPVTTTTTTETLNGNGSVTSVTTKTTDYTNPTAITISGIDTPFGGGAAPYSFTFANMSAAAQTIPENNGEVFSFTPDAATNSVKVLVLVQRTIYDQYSVALPTQVVSKPVTTTSAPPTTTTFVTTIAPPPATTTTSSSATTPPTTTTVVSTLAAPPPPSTTSSATTTPPTTSTVVSTLAALPPPSTTSTSATKPPEIVDLASTLTPPAPIDVATGSETPPIAPETNPTPAPEPVGTGPQQVATDAAGEEQIEIARCGVETPPCVADALDAYAAQLDKIASQLPPQMRNLPNVIRETARKVRSAKSGAEARRYVMAAIVEVRHTISLLRADDPDARAFGVEIGTQAVGVLQSASAKLERASEL